MGAEARSRGVWVLAGLAVAAGAAGCGGGAAAPGTTTTPAPGAASAPAATSTTTTTPPLVAYEHRYGTVAVTEDVDVAPDGAVVIGRFAGGGGRREQRCRLSSAQVASLRRRLEALPVPSRDHPAADRPDTFALTTQRFSQREATGTVPPAFARVRSTFTALLTARIGGCRTTDQSR